jgi:hypothetical protein
MICTLFADKKLPINSGDCITQHPFVFMERGFMWMGDTGLPLKPLE